MIENLTGLAGAAAQMHEGIHAARLYGVVEHVRTELGIQQNPADQAEYELNTAAVQAHLEPAAFTAAWEEGCAMTLDQAIVYGMATQDKT